MDVGEYVELLPRADDCSEPTLELMLGERE